MPEPSTRSRSEPTARTTPDRLHLDPHRRVVRRRRERIPLTAREFALLEVLVEREGQPSTREELARRVWGSTMPARTDAVERCVEQLRAKLGDVVEIVGPDAYRLRI
jgi:DNA-binding response OmpR family regulator